MTARHIAIRSLEAFEAFGRLGSVTAAAAELGVTVGAVSQQLRKAEDSAGIRLFERIGKSIALTARGREYHADVRRAFDLLRDASSRLERAKSETTLTISCLPSLASKWLGARLLDWQMAHPTASIRLIGSDTEPVLGEEDVDFRLSYGDLVTRFPHRTELFTDWVVPACSPRLLESLKVNTPGDILNAPLIGVQWATEQGEAPGWDKWAAHIGVTRCPSRAEVSFSLSSAAIDAAINTRGFVLAQLSMAGDDIATGRLVVPFDLRMRLPRPYALAWDSSALDKPLGPELRGYIQKIARKQAALSKPVAAA